MASATETTLLLIFLSILFFNPAFSDSGHHSSPSNNDNQTNNNNQHHNFKEPLTTFIKSDNYQNDTDFDLLFGEGNFNKISCNLREVAAWAAECSQDVVILSGKNFSDFLAKNRHVVVFFYMRWCPPCWKMVPEYAAAAKMLKGEAAFAMVDTFVEQELREKYNLHEYPMLYFFIGGVKLYHSGSRRSEFMGKNRNVMVMFYANWCYWSKKLAPEFAAAAKMLKGEAELVMVDAYLERDLAKEYNILADIVDFVVDGIAVSYKSLNSWDVISAWVREKMTLGTYSITTTDEAERILTVESKLVLGFLHDLEGMESEELAAASKLHSDVNFYQTTSADVAEFFHIHPKSKRPALIFLHLEAGKATPFRHQFTRLAIANFVTHTKHPLVVTLTIHNAEFVFQDPRKQLWLFAPAYGSDKVILTFEEVAKALKGKLLHVYVEMNSEGVGRRVSQEFGVSGNAPRVIAYSARDAKKYVLNGELTLSSIKSFGEEFLEDKLLNQSDQISETILKLPSQSRASYQLRTHE
ncbi:protein disulfide isomerase-like 1-3 [Citrus sinensis]|uniref:Protein disulfide isomerase-like 1-3 n=1 Tax=Citrus sinensis TaxID=2711 RepID=A0ACB8L4D2_CITSI|nr:protein disulfide isomerase-like 1-3 [Citrus sinensis]